MCSRYSLQISSNLLPAIWPAKRPPTAPAPRRSKMPTAMPTLGLLCCPRCSECPSRRVGAPSPARLHGNCGGPPKRIPRRSSRKLRDLYGMAHGEAMMDPAPRRLRATGGGKALPTCRFATVLRPENLQSSEALQAGNHGNGERACQQSHVRAVRPRCPCHRPRGSSKPVLRRVGRGLVHRVSGSRQRWLARFRRRASSRRARPSSHVA